LLLFLMGKRCVADDCLVLLLGLTVTTGVFLVMMIDFREPFRCLGSTTKESAYISSSTQQTIHERRTCRRLVVVMIHSYRLIGDCEMRTMHGDVHS